jgi:hypothetical protein
VWEGWMDEKRPSRSFNLPLRGHVIMIYEGFNHLLGTGRGVDLVGLALTIPSLLFEGTVGILAHSSINSKLRQLRHARVCHLGAASNDSISKLCLVT